MTKKYSIKWLSTPKEGNYFAAYDYLRLLVSDDEAHAYCSKLEAAPISEFMAKDILRASGLTLLNSTNKTVQKDLEKIKEGIPLSPILLVRGKDKLVVADGFHRLVAAYNYSETCILKCKIV